MSKISDIDGLNWLRAKFEMQENSFRNSDLYKLLKKELSKREYWRNKPRGDAKKGYLLGIGKDK